MDVVEHVCWVRRGTQRVDAQLPNADVLVGTGYQLPGCYMCVRLTDR